MFYFLVVGHLALRTVLIAGRAHVMNVRSQVRSEKYSKSSSDPYSRVFHLQHHLDKSPPDEQFQYVLTAALLVNLLAKKTSFFNPEREIRGLPGKLKPLEAGQEPSEGDSHYIGR